MDTELTVRKVMFVWLWLVMICVALIGMEKLGWSQAWWVVTDRLTVPVKRTVWMQESKVREKFAWWNYWREGQVELQGLRRALIDRARLVTELGELESENVRLRGLLGMPLSTEWSFVSSRVVGRSGTEVVIDRGTEHGVETGMMAVNLIEEKNNKGIALVGKVSRTNPRQAWVQLVTSDKTRLSVAVRGRMSGEVIGEGVLVWSQTMLSVDKLLPHEQMGAGDVVITKGEAFDVERGLGWLAGIPVGVVMRVNFEQETDVYQQAVVSLLVDEENLDEVFVVKEW